MKLRTLIVEDSQEITATLAHFLHQSAFETELVGTAETILEAEQLLLQGEVHLALLDIQLKEDNIFNLLDKLKKEERLNFDIIFITAHSSFENAVKAIQYACLDFITKPISQEALDDALQKVVDRWNMKKSMDKRVEVLLEILHSQVSKPKSISISLPKGVIEVLAIDSISHLEADANTCMVHLVDKSRLHSTKSLGTYIRLLASHPDFMQVSRDLLVNIQQIKRYHHRDKSLLLKNGESLVVSHRYSKYLKQKLIALNPSDSTQNLFSFFKK